MDTIQSAGQRLSALRKQIRILYVAYTLVCGVAVVLLFQGRTAGIALGVVAVLFYIAYLRRQVRRYSDDCTEANVRFGVCGPLGDVAYQKKNLWDMEWLKGLHMLPAHGEKGSLLTRHGFRGRHRDFPVEGAETTLHYQADGAKGKPTFLFLSGTMLSAALEERDRGDWLVLREDLLLPQARDAYLEEWGYRPAPFGDTRLEEGYLLYTTRPEQAFPPDVGKKLRPLVQPGSKLGALRLSDTVAAAFLDTRFYTQRIPPRNQPTAELLQYNAIAERDDLLELFSCWNRI